MGEEFNLGSEISVFFKGEKIGVAQSMSCVVVGGPPTNNSKEIAELMNDPDKRVIVGSEISIDLKKCKVSQELAKMLFSEFDLDYRKVPPRHGRYRTKRLRKKWAKIHGLSTVYYGCSIIGSS